MILIAREELIIAVVEGVFISFGILFVLGGLIVCVDEAVKHIKHKRRCREADRILSGWRK
jgi:hypothetical protein